MKRIAKIATAVLMAIALTGCMKLKMNVDVKSNGKVTTSIKMLVSTQLLKASGTTKETLIKQWKEELTQDNSKVKVTEISEKEDDVTYVGIKATNAYSSSITSTVKNNKITIKIPMSQIKSALASNNIDKKTLESYNYSVSQLKKLGVESTIVVNMPNKAKSNIGTVKGNKVTIDLFEEAMKDSSKQVDTIVVTSKASSFDPYVLGGALAGVVVLALVCFFVIRKKKPRKKKTEDTEEIIEKEEKKEE